MEEQAIRAAAEYLQSQAEWEPYEAIDALVEKGIPQDLAEAAIRIGPLPFGRVLMKELEVVFSSEYLRFDEMGELTANGKLDEHPIYVAATKLARDLNREPLWQKFAIVSAEVKFVDRTLHEADPEQPIIIGPIVYFSAPPSIASIDRVEAYLASRS